MKRVQTMQGDLTNHALDSGVGQTRYAGNCKVTLWKEHGKFHVRGVYASGTRKGERAFWQTHDKLRDARRDFYSPVHVGGKK